MAALFVQGRPAPTHPITSPRDLLHARYGGEPASQFVQEHRALLRRLGGDDPALLVELADEELFGALADGTIDVAPDYGGILPTYQRAAGPGQPVAVLPYRDCGVSAYGTGLVATGRALREHPGAVRAFLAVVASAYRAMRSQPEATVKAAGAALPEVDVDDALTEWREEEPAIFDPAHRLGEFDRPGWEQTVAWRREVAGFQDPPDPGTPSEMVR
jgi:ABC-type nitrate/sulfonate/bicarbonate transport system substrate-binding protein